MSRPVNARRPKLALLADAPPAPVIADPCEALLEEGVISEPDLSLFQYADDPEQAWSLIQAFYRLPA